VEWRGRSLDWKDRWIDSQHALEDVGACVLRWYLALSVYYRVLGSSGHTKLYTGSAGVGEMINMIVNTTNRKV